MDREANLQVRPTINAATKSSSSPPDFLRHVQAAFKRHRPLATTMQTNNLMPRRMLVPQNDASESTSTSSDVGCPKKFHDVVIPSSQIQARKSSTSKVIQIKNPVTVIRETQEDASLTPPPILTSTITTTFEEITNPNNVLGDQSKSVFDSKDNNPMPMPFSHAENKRKVQFTTANNATSQGADHQMATGLKNLSSHLSSLALTEMEWDAGNPVEALNIIIDESKHQKFQNIASDIYLRSNAAGSSLPKRTMAVQDQLHQLRNFLGQPVTQSSVIGTSCATTTSVHSTSAPTRSSTTYCYRSHPEGATHVAVEPLGDFNASSHHMTQQNMEHLSYPSLKDTRKMTSDQTDLAAQASMTAVDGQIKEHHVPIQKQDYLPKRTDILKKPSVVSENPTTEKGLADNATDVQSQDPSFKDQLSNAKVEPSKEEKQGKVTGGKGSSVPHKKNYDPDLFFKVNGKLYQRLGKIGSGGSSEVHKVISSDCRIYALKKIKLKGRDSATAYGFCQEILYLNKLKGKNNIIQLIDYEVTDKNLLREVMNESMSNKDGRVKDDGYIYMVLEYGEIDLAHMLSQKWKEIDCTNQTIDENWLRFYWQQILQAVNTIHEERIVHSDLKPANFLLVKGSLKLIDFGIAKAIMSDTTNIQRESQVGTLSYMSPEAFMCNECDANGNIIKCGRPSDIWSLGCILYQMVYGRTPFAEYKTFWAKFKVITDPNHEITYEPVSNPWLLDLMKKCLAWDRKKRWRIPQLLQHPFLVPPMPSLPSITQSQECNLLQLVAETCTNNQEASKLMHELRQVLDNPVASLTGQSLTTQNQQCKVLLSQMSMLCFQLRECLLKSESE